jgi:hypothetical protein
MKFGDWEGRTFITMFCSGPLQNPLCSVLTPVKGEFNTVKYPTPKLHHPSRQHPFYIQILYPWYQCPTQQTFYTLLKSDLSYKFLLQANTKRLRNFSFHFKKRGGRNRYIPVGFCKRSKLLEWRLTVLLVTPVGSEDTATTRRHRCLGRKGHMSILLTPPPAKPVS